MERTNTLLTALEKAQEKLRTIKGIDVSVNGSEIKVDPVEIVPHNGLAEGLIRAKPLYISMDLTVCAEGLAPVKVQTEYRLDDIISTEANYIDEALHIDKSLDNFTEEDVYTLRLGYILFKTYQAALTGEMTIPTITHVTSTIDSSWQDPDLSLDYLKLAE